jgi:hypothetical protein
MSDFKNSNFFKHMKALGGAPDPMQEVKELQVDADPYFQKVGTFAPAPKPKERPSDYAARLGEHAAAWGPEDRKRVNRYNLPPAALAEWVKQDLEIMEAEAERPRYSLKPGELREVIKTDRGGRQIHEFYSDEATGVKPWLDMFKPAVIKYVSGGSKGIATNDDPTGHYNFNKSQIIPELVELQRQAAYMDSAEFRIIKAYAEAGKVPPAEVLAKLKA